MFSSWLMKYYFTVSCNMLIFRCAFCTGSKSLEATVNGQDFVSKSSINRIPCFDKCPPHNVETEHTPLSDILNKVEDADKKNWVDPNNMFSYNPSTKTERAKKVAVIDAGNHVDNSRSESSGHCSDCYEQLKACHRDKLSNFTHTKSDKCSRMEFPFLLRILKILINRINLDSSTDSETLSFQFKFKREDIKTIMLFIDSPCHHIQDVELSLSHVISESTSANFNGISLEMPRFTYDSYLAWILCAFLGLVSVWTCIVIVWASRFHLIKITFFLLVICSIFWHWMHLYKSRLADKLAKLDQLSPANCFSIDHLNMWSSFMLWVRTSFVVDNDDCTKYHKAILVDPFWEVSPLMALSETLSVFVLHPLGLIGDNFSILIKNSFSHLPFYLAIPLSVIVIIILCMLLIMMFGYRLRLPFFLGTLEPVSPSNWPFWLYNSKNEQSFNALNLRRVQEIENDSSRNIEDNNELNCGDCRPREVCHSVETWKKGHMCSVKGAGESSQHIEDIKSSDISEKMDKYCQTS